MSSTDIDDRFVAGFVNYPQFKSFELVVNWLRGEPTTVLVMTDGIITAALDDNERRWSLGRIKRLVDHVRGRQPWLIVHDADSDFWLKLGFVQVEPPADVEEPVLVYVWGVGPEYAKAAMKERGLPWVRWGGDDDEPIGPIPFIGRTL